MSLLVFPLGLVFAFNLLVNDRRRCRQTVCQAKLTMLGTTYWGGALAFIRFEVQKRIPALSYCFALISIAGSLEAAPRCFVLISMVS